jgi:ribosomal protein S14
MQAKQFTCGQEKQESRKCENCGFQRGFMAYIPFNGGMIVCRACFKEWKRLGKPRTVEDYHRAVNAGNQTKSESNESGNAAEVSFNGERCENCKAKLFGNLRVSSGTIGGVGYVSVSEDGARNWILCDSCNALHCRLCAPNHKTGFCENCIKKHNLRFDAEGGLL